MSKKKGHSKRHGSKGVQTKRSPMNKHNFEARAGYEVRMLNREKYFKVINEHYKIKKQSRQVLYVHYTASGRCSIQMQWPIY